MIDVEAIRERLATFPNTYHGHRDITNLLAEVKRLTRERDEAMDFADWLTRLGNAMSDAVGSHRWPPRMAAAKAAWDAEVGR